MRLPAYLKFVCAFMFTLAVLSAMPIYGYMHYFGGKPISNYSELGPPPAGRLETFPKLEAKIGPIWPAFVKDFEAHTPPDTVPLPGRSPDPTLERLLVYAYVDAAFFMSPDHVLYVVMRHGRRLEAFQQDLKTWTPIIYQLRAHARGDARYAHDRITSTILQCGSFWGDEQTFHSWPRGWTLVFEKGNRRQGYLGYMVDNGAVLNGANRLLESHGLSDYAEAVNRLDGSGDIPFRGHDARHLARVFAFQPSAQGYDLMNTAADREFALRLCSLTVALILGVVATGRALRETLAERAIALAQSNFVSAVSHEMRTPLTTIKLYAEMLEQGVVDSAERRQEYLRTMTQECDRLTRLIENVLDLATISRKRRAYHFAQGDMDALLQEAVAALRGPLERAGTPVTIACAPGLRATVDHDVVLQAIVNLLANALKYAPSEQGVRLSAEMSGTALVISVSDHGPGIPAREQRRIFRPFYRMGDELTRQAPGSGLGLALVREYARAHGGKVELESKQGAGATFRLVLPQKRKTA